MAGAGAVFGEAAGADHIPGGSWQARQQRQKPPPALTWCGAPGIALLLAPHVSLPICSSLAPRTARRGDTTISGKYFWQSL